MRELRRQRLPDGISSRSITWIALIVVRPFLMIGLAILVARALWLWAAILLSLLLLLAAQRAYQTLVHDSAHYFFSVRARRNDLLANWLCAGWIGMDVSSYRKVHLQHHTHNGSINDPEHVSMAEIRSQGGVSRMIIRYALCMEALRLFRKYFFQRPGSKELRSEAGARNSFASRFLALAHIGTAQVLLMLAFFLAEVWWLYPLWLYLAVSLNPLLSRLRFLAEHPGSADTTITTTASPFETLFFAPQFFNYHCEHHGWPLIPPYRLPLVHRYLRDNLGFFESRGELLSGSFIQTLLWQAGQEESGPAASQKKADAV